MYLNVGEDQMSQKGKRLLHTRKGWKTLKEFFKDPATLAKMKERRENEFPAGFHSPAEDDGITMDRRTFLALLSASMAVTATACRRPDYKLVPAVKSVEYRVPGVANYYTTVFQHGNVAYGVEVKTREGRPVHLDGNVDHPVSGGKSSALLQAQLLTLYDPDRMTTARLNGRSAPPKTVLKSLIDAIGVAAISGGKTYFLVEEHCSPTLESLYQLLQEEGIEVVQFPAVFADTPAAVNQQLFGIDGEFVPQLHKADTILSVDADFLGTDKLWVYHTRHFANGRSPSPEHPEMKKLLVAEAALSLTGAKADHRIKLHPAQYNNFLAAVLLSVAELTGQSQWKAVAQKANPSALEPELQEQAKQVAVALTQQGQQGVVLVGAHLSHTAHALAAALNQALGAFGKGKVFDSQYVLPNSHQKQPGLQKFLQDLAAGNVQTIVFLNTNPYYYGTTQLQELLDKVEEKYSCALYYDETARKAKGFIPAAHFLEHWNDAEAFDGTLTLQQPVIAPLNENSIDIPTLVFEVAKALGKVEDENFFAYLQGRWEAEWEASEAEDIADYFSDHWINVLRKGAYVPWAAQTREVSVATPTPEQVGALVQSASAAQNLVCYVTPDYTIYDGKYANNAWLLELPDPITKVVWDNVAAMSYQTAKKLHLKQEDVVELETPRGKVLAAVYLQPGMADDVIHITLGWGRTAGGIVSERKGSNAYRLVDGIVDGQTVGYYEAKLQTTKHRYPIVTTQEHFLMEGRPIVLETTLSRIQAGNEELIERVEVPGKPEDQPFAEPPSIMAEYEYEGHRWAMVIDLSKCTGCSACIIACQAENNVPTVGKDEVRRGREMHWIRLDLYYIGDPENPEVAVQPMLCQHCENAPCENVCPVAATVHSPEGLNEMVYNRCVGTRYCLNNCPYKVRRFNFYDYHTETRSPIEMVFNPDVTVRMRGVMEKCTFCVQRLNEAKWHARQQGRDRVKDGEAVTACQQACPADAIIFGDRNDPKSRVHQLWTNERGYWVLEEWNTRPQVTYLANVRNDDSVA